MKFHYKKSKALNSSLIPMAYWGYLERPSIDGESYMHGVCLELPKKRLYFYPGEYKLFMQLINAASPGRFYNQHLKGLDRSEEVTDIAEAGVQLNEAAAPLSESDMPAMQPAPKQTITVEFVPGTDIGELMEALVDADLAGRILRVR